jgi:hypothetical protein
MQKHGVWTQTCSNLSTTGHFEEINTRKITQGSRVGIALSGERGEKPVEE